MKKAMAVFLNIILLVSLTACGPAGNVEKGEVAHGPPPEEPVFMEIAVLAGDQTLDGVLFDNQTARAVAGMLPLTVQLWNPAPGFAKSFRLPEQVPDTGQRTRQYEKGGLAYWYEGSSVTLFYGDHLAETVVPVVTIGRITSDVDFLEEYNDSITIMRKEETT